MPKIYISVEGGAVQACYSDIDIDVILVDLDNLQGADDEEREEIEALNSEMLQEFDSGIIKAVL